MATTTPNIGLTLPVGTENVSRQVINNNWEIIDTAMGVRKVLYVNRTQVSMPAVEGGADLGRISRSEILINSSYPVVCVAIEMGGTTKTSFDGGPCRFEWQVIRNQLGGAYIYLDYIKDKMTQSDMPAITVTVAYYTLQ